MYLLLISWLILTILIYLISNDKNQYSIIRRMGVCMATCNAKVPNKSNSEIVAQ